MIYYYDRDYESEGLIKTFNVSAFPTIVITDHTENIIKKFVGYGGQEDFVNRVYSDEYLYELFEVPEEYSNFKKDEKSLEGLGKYLVENQVKITDPKSREYRSEIKNIYKRYFNKVEAIDSIYIDITLTKMENKEDAWKWGLNNSDQILNIIGKQAYKTQMEYLNYQKTMKGRSKLNSGKFFKSLEKRADKLKYLFEENDAYKDSIYNIVAFMSLRHFPERLSLIEKGERAYVYKENLFYRVIGFRYNNLNYFKPILDFAANKAMDYECAAELNKLIQAIDNNPYYSKYPNFLEIKSIGYYRLNKKEEAIENMIQARTIAEENKINYNPIIHELKASGQLTPIKNKCSDH